MFLCDSLLVCNVSSFVVGYSVKSIPKYRVNVGSVYLGIGFVYKGVGGVEVSSGVVYRVSEQGKTCSV